MTERWINFTAQGYSDYDGLGEGQWVPVPGSAGIQRWVGDLEMKAESKKRRGVCLGCSAVIDQRSERCRSCAGREWNEKRWGRAS